MEKLSGITLASPEYRDEDKVQLFYSESWGLVHFLLVPSAMERGKRLREFLTLLEKGGDPKQAFRDTIGDFKGLRFRIPNLGEASCHQLSVCAVVETKDAKLVKRLKANARTTRIARFRMLDQSFRVVSGTSTLVIVPTPRGWQLPFPKR